VKKHEKAVSKLVKEYAHRVGIKTVPTVHFRKANRKNKANRNKTTKQSANEKYVPLHYATQEMVKETKEAFSPHQAHHDASVAVEHVMAAEPIQEESEASN